MHASRVVGVEVEIERRERRHRSRDTDRLLCRRVRSLLEHGAGSAGALVQLLRARRIRVDEPLRVAHGADVEARVKVVHDQLGRAAADVDHERRRLRLDAAPSQLRLLVTADEAGRKAITPFHLAEKCLAVLRVAHRARRHRERALGAEALERAPVIGEHVAHTRDRNGEESAARVDPLAEAGDVRLAVHLVDAAVYDVGDEQPRRVRPEVDRCDSHLRG